MSFSILICDDSALARKMVSRSLPSQFVNQIECVCNGQEAIQKLTEGSFTLLILDLMMPTMNGIEVLETLNERCIKVFVIIVSGNIQPEMKSRVAKLGVLEFIEKPVDKIKLQNVLTRFGLY
ncbi:response regulator [Aliiglaciecola sp. 3_MG-2023]|uniref:response regulator n=1 Tax=Aliiglaciecola sp. 3_MG-2023 TaxID=3062644 RepID=UPI0026E48C04|nr:response regulator [Aliiglaciecola sp. 3_MG-2023]MDO6692818.1 response regulator [Aliiglaciecola sp. 3_MG-2023]